MGTYKVIQDIEAEDKLFGPFSLRQFIYLIIVIGLLFVGFKLLTSAWFLIFLLLPFILFFGLLALPFGQQQSTEVWLLAKIRFALKPRKRIWDQTGVQELVTITAPKVVEKHLVKNLSQGEVRSRLQALANTIDSRGWAVKNVDVNMFTSPAMAMAGGSDRLLSPGLVTTSSDVHAADDMFAASNATTQYIDQMMQASNQSHREQIVAQMKESAQTQTQPQQPSGAGAQPDYWFLNSTAASAPLAAPGYSTFPSTGVITPAPSAPQPAQNPANQPATVPDQQESTLADEQALLAQLRANEETRPTNNVWNHLKTIKPIAEQEAEAAQASVAPPTPPEPPMTPAPDPAILGLANNDDLNVATIAREANKANDNTPPDDEVVISLH